MGNALGVQKNRTINKVVLIPVELIQPNRNQPRKTFSQKEIDELTESIRSNGLLQPLTVRKVGEIYELIAGERRLRACIAANMVSIPSVIITATDQQSAIYSLIENIQRADLNYFEEANAMKNLIVEWGVSQAELGTKLGKAQSTVANKIRLLKFDEITQQIMIGHGINERQARALLKITNEEKLFEAIDYISINKLSAAQTERYVDAIESAKKPPKKTFRPIVRDVRIFFNTINHAIKVMNDSGIPASAQKIESGDYIEYLVKIPLSQNTVSR